MASGPTVHLTFGDATSRSRTSLEFGSNVPLAGAVKEEQSLSVDRHKLEEGKGSTDRHKIKTMEILRDAARSSTSFVVWIGRLPGPIDEAIRKFHPKKEKEKRRRLSFLVDRRSRSRGRVVISPTIVRNKARHPSLLSASCSYCMRSHWWWMASLFGPARRCGNKHVVDYDFHNDFIAENWSAGRDWPCRRRVFSVRRLLCCDCRFHVAFNRRPALERWTAAHSKKLSQVPQQTRGHCRRLPQRGFQQQ